MDELEKLIRDQKREMARGEQQLTELHLNTARLDMDRIEDDFQPEDDDPAGEFGQSASRVEKDRTKPKVPEGRAAAGPVRITRADGTVTVQPAYTEDEDRRVRKNDRALPAHLPRDGDDRAIEEWYGKGEQKGACLTIGNNTWGSNLRPFRWAWDGKTPRLVWTNPSPATTGFTSGARPGPKFWDEIMQVPDRGSGWREYHPQLTTTGSRELWDPDGKANELSPDQRRIQSLMKQDADQRGGFYVLRDYPAGWYKTMAPDDRRAWLARWKAGIASGEPYTEEERALDAVRDREW